MWSFMWDFVQTLAIFVWILLMFQLRHRQDRLESGLNRLEMTPPAEDPQPICGCEHHQCFHDESGCGNQSNMYNGRSGQYEIIPCGCKRYTGPEALPTVLP